MVSMYCDCKDETTSGHCSLLPIADVWVHGKCLRPSYLVWVAYGVYCDECGRFCSTPSKSTICRWCNPFILGWKGTALKYKKFVARRDAHFYLVRGQTAVTGRSDPLPKISQESAEKA